jgi:hypothetical protein
LPSDRNGEPAENGVTGHQTPMVSTNVSNVCRWSLRTSTDWRTGGRRSAVTVPGT